MPASSLPGGIRVREAHVQGPSRHDQSGAELPCLMAWMTRAIAYVPGPFSSSTAINLARSLSICEAPKAMR